MDGVPSRAAAQVDHFQWRGGRVDLGHEGWEESLHLNGVESLEEVSIRVVDLKGVSIFSLETRKRI